MPNIRYDCLIVGGGPAGLLAAIYLARSRRRVILFDDGRSRAKLIPESHNYPGYSGISGERLIAKLQQQAADFGVHACHARVAGLTSRDDFFRASADGVSVDAARVLFATGIVDRQPAIAGATELIDQGLLRLCPICDAYEATDQHIGVLGPFARACQKALFLRTYSRQVTLFVTEPFSAECSDAARLKTAGVRIAEGEVQRLERRGDGIAITTSRGDVSIVDTLYPALGADPRSELAGSLGARTNDEGCLLADDHQRLSVPGLYGAGDVVTDLNQISVAFGHAAIAATDIHNSLPRNDR